MQNDAQLDAVFGALSDGTRRRIVERLCRAEEMSALEIAAMFESAQPTISKHLKVLELADLVERRREGRRHLFKINRNHLDRVADWSNRHLAIWEASLDRLSDDLGSQSE